MSKKVLVVVLAEDADPNEAIRQARSRLEGLPGIGTLYWATEEDADTVLSVFPPQ